MKLVTISDLHGCNVWKELNVNAYDNIIFLGDYTDSYQLDDKTIYTNLCEIIELKQQQPDKVTLLIGNHDVQYMYFPNYSCSGFRPKAQQSLTALFAKHSHLFQIAYQRGNYLFTHAGVSSGWLTDLLTLRGHAWSDIATNFDLAGLFNLIQQSPRQRGILFAAGPVRGGDALFGGPVWADRSETQADFLAGYHQVVGHTPVSKFMTFGDSAGSITYTDILRTRTAFYEVIIAD